MKKAAHAIYLQVTRPPTSCFSYLQILSRGFPVLPHLPEARCSFGRRPTDRQAPGNSTPPAPHEPHPPFFCLLEGVGAASWLSCLVVQGPKVLLQVLLSTSSSRLPVLQLSIQRFSILLPSWFFLEHHSFIPLYIHSVNIFWVPTLGTGYITGNQIKSLSLWSLHSSWRTQTIHL